MKRNFGLSHVIPRASLRANLPGLRARLLYTAERFFQCAPYSFGQTHRPSGQPVAVRVELGGRVLFAHGENTYPETSTLFHTMRGD